MSASITLTYTIKQTREGAVSLSFRAVGFEMDGAVFAIEVLPKSADPANPNYRFSYVCSPSELIEFPRDNPGDWYYFRVDNIELIFDTDQMVPHVIYNMRHDVAKLANAYRELEDAQEVTRTEEF